MQGKLPALGAVLLLSGCVQPYSGEPPRVVSQQPALATQDQTANLENADRIARFRRLAATQGIAPPQVDQLYLPPNSVNYMSGPVPVVRVVFDERVFFDFNSAVPRSEASPVFDLIAENMRRDVPDAALTVLGHTDAVGTEVYNVDLSARRAANVMRELVRRGVNPVQLSEVAIGKRQPIASNDTAQGRARNRRVEFLVSSGIDANLAAVQQRVVPANYLSLGDGPETTPRTAVAQVLRMTSQAQPALNKPTLNQAMLIPLGGLKLRPPVDEAVVQRQATGRAADNAPSNGPNMIAPEAVQPVTLLKPEDLHLKDLGDERNSY